MTCSFNNISAFNQLSNCKFFCTFCISISSSAVRTEPERFITSFCTSWFCCFDFDQTFMPAVRCRFWSWINRFTTIITHTISISVCMTWKNNHIFKTHFCIACFICIQFSALSTSIVCTPSDFRTCSIFCFYLRHLVSCRNHCLLNILNRLCSFSIPEVFFTSCTLIMLFYSVLCTCSRLSIDFLHAVYV